MTEFVLLRFEDWAPVLSSMRKLALLPSSQLKDMVESINKLESGLKKVPLGLKFLLDFVEWVTKNLNAIQEQRQARQTWEDVEGVEGRMRNKVTDAFETLESTFSNDFDFWKAWLTFTTGQKMFADAQQLFNRPIIEQFGSSHPVLYEQASLCLIELDFRNIEHARLILAKGATLRNQAGWAFGLYSIRLELRYADIILTKALREDALKEELQAQFGVSIEFIKVCLTQAVDDPGANDFYVKCFEELSNYDHPEFEDVKSTIKVLHAAWKEKRFVIEPPELEPDLSLLHITEQVNDVLQKNESPDVGRALKGVGKAENEAAVDAIAEKHFAKAKLKTACEVLETGLARFNTIEMFELAINRLCATVRKYYSKRVIYWTLHNILELGLKEDKLTPNAFKNWIGMCCAIGVTGIPTGNDGVEVTLERDMFSPVEKDIVLKAGLKKYPTDLFLNEQSVFVEMERENILNQIRGRRGRGAPKKTKMVEPNPTKESDLDKAVNKLREVVESNEASSTSSDTKTETFNSILFRVALFSTELQGFRRSIEKRAAVVDFIHSNPSSAAEYLEFLCAFGGVEVSRAFHSKLRCRDDPLVLTGLGRIEYRISLDSKGQPDEIKYNRFRSIMGKACKLHGKDDIEVWIKYMELEKELGNNVRVSKIYLKGLSAVKEELKASLAAKYAELQK